MWKLNRDTYPQRAGGAESPAEIRPGKWSTEGEGKGDFAKYLRRKPTLPAENVLAFLKERICFYKQINKGGTADVKVCPFIKDRLFYLPGNLFVPTKTPPVPLSRRALREIWKARGIDLVRWKGKMNHGKTGN